MRKYLALFLLFLSSHCFAENLDYWSFDIPAPEAARNVVFDKELSLYTLSLKYEIEVADEVSLYEFYNDYFATVGWENPLEEYARSRNMTQAGWTNYQMNFNKMANRPEAKYLSAWQKKEPVNAPVNAKVVLTLTEYKDDVFTASVEVAVGPQLKIPEMLELNQMFSGNAKVFYQLYNELGVNPFEILEAVKVREDSENKSEVTQQYFEIVDKILLHYKKFGEEYMSQE